MERSTMLCPFLGTLEEEAKRAKTKILSARCPASNCLVLDKNVDLIIIYYMSE